MRKNIASVIGVCVAVGFSPLAAGQEVHEHDIVVYGGSSGGVAAAVQAARMDRDVVLIAPIGHVGGLTTGGLGQTDIGSRDIIGGFAREFYERVHDHYDDAEAWVHETRDEYLNEGPWEWYFRQSRGWTRSWSDGRAFTFEPHVAQGVMDEMLEQAEVPVVKEQRLLREGGAGVEKEDGRITRIVMEDGTVYEAAVFIDGTYEGDLMAEAGVSYFIGRESNEKYDETINGINTGMRDSGHQFSPGVDPYVVEGDQSSGLLPWIDPEGPGGEDGEGDHRVQSYCLRLTLSYDPANMVEIEKPEGYREQDYELLFRQFEVAGKAHMEAPYDEALPLLIGRMPNKKTDANTNGGLSTNLVGASWEWPDASYERREQLYEKHRRHAHGLLWTLQNHERIPEPVRAEAVKWGLPADEFEDNDHWTPQIYVREARRMVSDRVMTQNEVEGSAPVEDPIAMGGYGMDSHHVQRYVTEDGDVQNEGNMWVGTGSYGISYRSMVPAREDEVENLIVPVCISASHAAWGSIRMEPVFMMLGHAAGVAASHAIDEDAAVQDVDFMRLYERLIEDGQVLPAPSAQSVDPQDLEGIVITHAEAELRGAWSHSTSLSGYVGNGYLHDRDAGKGQKSARFVAELADGDYEVQFAYVPHGNRATNVPVRVHHAEGVASRSVNQRTAPPVDLRFVSLGTFRFESGTPATITVDNRGTDGHVLVDAVRFLNAEQ